MKPRGYLLNFFLLFVCGSAAQVQPNFVQFYNHKLFFTPTVFGDNFNVGLSYKNQFSGVEGSPTVLSADVEYPFNDKISMAIVFLNDRQGNENNFTKKVSGAYRLKLLEDNFIVFGISANLAYKGILSNAWIAPEDNRDNNIPDTSSSSLSYNIGLGVSYWWREYILSFSISDLLASPIVMSGYSHTKNRYYYVMAESVFEISNNYSMHPALLYSTNLKAHSVDFSAILSLYDDFKVGGSYRLNDSIGLIMGYQIMGNIDIMYSYDYGVLNNYGNHEITVNFGFDNERSKNIKIKKVENIRFL